MCSATRTACEGTRRTISMGIVLRAVAVAVALVVEYEAATCSGRQVVEVEAGHGGVAGSDSGSGSGTQY